MDEVSKFRLIGAAIWLSLLVLIVPGWYSNPVNFEPEGAVGAPEEVNAPIVQQPYRLPDRPRVPHQQGAARDSEQNISVLAPVVSSSQKSSATQGLSASVEPVLESVVDHKAPKVIPASSAASNDLQGQWLVKVAAYKKLSNANKVLGMLDKEYNVWIKEFSASGTYSVRTGPYATRQEAEVDKRKIDRALHTQAQIVQVK
jgi:cell division septation protein DedD